MLARVALHMAQAIDTVAHHESHSAGIKIWPDRLRTMTLFGLEEGLSDFIEGRVPAYLRKSAAAFRTGTTARNLQTVRMVDPLGIARDLAADDPRCVGVVGGSADLVDVATVHTLHFQCAA